MAKMKLRLFEFFKILVRKACRSIFLFIKLEQGIMEKLSEDVHKSKEIVAEMETGEHMEYIREETNDT